MFRDMEVPQSGSVDRDRELRLSDRHLADHLKDEISARVECDLGRGQCSFHADQVHLSRVICTDDLAKLRLSPEKADQFFGNETVDLMGWQGTRGVQIVVNMRALLVRLARPIGRAVPMD